MDKVRIPKIPKIDQPIFRDDDITRLLAVCDNARDRAIIMFLIDTGVRGTELLKLNVEDVDMKRGAVLMR